MLALSCAAVSAVSSATATDVVGMSEDEALLHNFLYHATANEPNASKWPAIWELNGLQDPLQTGQTALRYSLAYVGYAAAALAAARTPAYLLPGEPRAPVESPMQPLPSPVESPRHLG